MATAPDFYLKTTIVKEGSTDLPLVTLPAGTVLFRGQKLPNPEKVDPRVFYRDFLGDPEGSQNVCINPVHNTFFYPFPYIAFGAADVGQTFDVMSVVVLVHPVTVVSMISPSQFVRGTAKRFSGTSPIQRCSSLTQSLCHPATAAELDAMQYDNCLHPDYQLRSKTRGWMAIAEGDALNRRAAAAGKGATSMAAYIKGLEGRRPGLGAELAAWSYTDSNRNHGFPEIALYPYKTHKGLKAVKRACKDINAAIRIMQVEAEADNLNYLPIASITKTGITDMTNGFFTYERLGVSANAFTTPALNKQPDIETRLAEYMDFLQTKGINLPYYGKSLLQFDSRTGFYVLQKVIPASLQITEKGETFPYRYLALPLDTADAKKRAMNYILMFRSVVDRKFMDKYGLDKGFGVKRAMIFDRPPVLTRLFQELNLEIPATFRDGIGRASRIYKENSTASTPVVAAAAAAAAPAARPKSIRPDKIQAARNFIEEGKNVIGGYGLPINPLGLSEEEFEVLGPEITAGKKPAGSTTPPPSTTPPGPPPSTTPPYKPASPLRGGSRKVKANPSKKSLTRKIRSKTVHGLAKAFSKVWSKFGKSGKK